MKGVRTTIRSLATTARCAHCDKIWHGNNALAVGARHAAAWGHAVEGYAAAEHRYEPT